jgi:BASS family bile acid:Na+ symporter
VTALLKRVCDGFPLWVLLACVWAWYRPADWTWFQPHIETGLAVIMLGMGLTLQFSDFAAVLRRPRQVALGVAAQFLIMPLTAWAVARGFRLEPGLAIGLILVGCCPGGTASNVICYLSRANVPLSVLLTMSSTIIAVVATPLLTRWLAGAWLPVDAWGLFGSMVKVVVAPLAAGIVFNTLVGRLRRPGVVRGAVAAWGPLVSVAVIVLIVACIVGGKKAEISRSAAPLFFSVFLLHGFGFLLGYLFAWVTGGSEEIRRTVSIEVGMQNSGLGAALAARHFQHLALAPVPGAVSAVCHCLIGSLLAAWWKRRVGASGPDRT